MAVTANARTDVQHVFQDLPFLAQRGATSTIAKFLSEQDLNAVRAHRKQVVAALVALPAAEALPAVAGLFSGRDENSPEAAFWSPVWLHIHNEATERRLASS